MYNNCQLTKKTVISTKACFLNWTKQISVNCNSQKKRPKLLVVLEMCNFTKKTRKKEVCFVLLWIAFCKDISILGFSHKFAQNLGHLCLQFLHLRRQTDHQQDKLTNISPTFRFTHFNKCEHMPTKTDNFSLPLRPSWQACSHIQVWPRQTPKLNVASQSINSQTICFKFKSDYSTSKCFIVCFSN